MNTRDALLSQFKENTGRHMLDSGGAYGRHWERNQERDIAGEPAATIEVWEDKDNPGHSSDWYVTFNTFQWLADYVQVEYSPEMQELYNEFVKDSEDCHLVDMENFVDHLIETRGATGFQGDRSPFTVNTYNHECLLDQTLQFTLFNLDSTPYVLLQVHGGCDVRGGYTSPVVYELDQFEGEYRLLDFAKAGISDGENSWYSDDGYNWYPSNDEPEIKDVPLKLDSEGRLLSPVNGEPLEAYFF